MSERILLALAALALLGVVLVRRELARRRTERLGHSLADVLPQRLRGPAIVYLTTPYCTVCRTVQAPALRRLQEQTGPALQLLTVDALERPDIASRLGIMSVPATAILDAEGRVRHINYGPAGVDTLLHQVAPLLDRLPSAHEPVAP
jgi:thiol-disulfide isomerase/thioredoxin